MSTITINVCGTSGTGKTTIAYLLADFLSNTGFATELNVTEEFELETFEEHFVDRLEALEEKQLKIVVNEVQLARESIHE
jgi:broad-specificity NMP kinase